MKKNRDALRGVWGAKLLTTVRGIKWECDTELLGWEYGEKTTCFHWTSVF